MNLGGRVKPPNFHNQDSALANSLMMQQANGQPPMGFEGFEGQYPYAQQPDYLPQQGQIPGGLYENGIPQIDTGFASPTYGSPPDEHRMGMSPSSRHLTALDAQLPESFDSRGISYIARNGPIAASFPARVGYESPAASLPQKSTIPSDAVRNLHDTAFGIDSKRNPTSNPGSSPLAAADDSIATRFMHSSRVTRPKMVSTSMPKGGLYDDWDTNAFAFEEDMLPANLQDEVLTPQEKARRLSRSENDGFFARDPVNIGTSAGKVGSPLGSSPSRFQHLFSKDEKPVSTPGSQFGHVGSPLRESLLAGSSPGLRPIGSRPQSGDVSPFLASPPRHGPSSISTLSQQLQRTRLGRNDSSENNPSSLHPASARHSSNPASRLGDRTVSSNSVGQSRIDEQPEEVFAMEEEEADTKRWSGGGWADVVRGKPGAGKH